jgi:hypothetical protein
MRRLCLLAVVPFLIALASLGCTTEDKRQWQEALRELRGENMRFGSHDRSYRD